MVMMPLILPTALQEVSDGLLGFFCFRLMYILFTAGIDMIATETLFGCETWDSFSMYIDVVLIPNFRAKGNLLNADNPLFLIIDWSLNHMNSNWRSFYTKRFIEIIDLKSDSHLLYMPLDDFRVFGGKYN